GSDVSSSQSQAPVATVADTSTAPSTDAPASAPTNPARPSVAVNAVRTGTASVARGQQLARNRVQGAPARIERPPATQQQPARAGRARLSAPPEAPAAPPAAREATAAVVDETIYSAKDRDVIPPQTSETLPGPTISGFTTRTNAMEVIVSQTGAVERV